MRRSSAGLESSSQSVSIYAAGAANVPMVAGSVTTTVTATGGNQPFSVQNPYLGMYVCIALVGVFPSRP